MDSLNYVPTQAFRDGSFVIGIKAPVTKHIIDAILISSLKISHLPHDPPVWDFSRGYYYGLLAFDKNARPALAALRSNAVGKSEYVSIRSYKDQDWHWEQSENGVWKEHHRGALSLDEGAPRFKRCHGRML